MNSSYKLFKINSYKLQRNNALCFKTRILLDFISCKNNSRIYRPFLRTKWCHYKKYADLFLFLSYSVIISNSRKRYVTITRKTLFCILEFCLIKKSAKFELLGTRLPGWAYLGPRRLARTRWCVATRGVWGRGERRLLRPPPESEGTSRTQC